MDKESIDIILGVLIGGTLFYLLTLLVLAQIFYSDFLEKIRKIKPDWREDLGGLFVAKNGGSFMSGVNEYWFRTPLPINYKSDDKLIQAAIERHDKLIKLFWISSLVLVPLVVLICYLLGK